MGSARCAHSHSSGKTRRSELAGRRTNAWHPGTSSPAACCHMQSRACRAQGDKTQSGRRRQLLTRLAAVRMMGCPVPWPRSIGSVCPFRKKCLHVHRSDGVPAGCTPCRSLADAQLDECAAARVSHGRSNWPQTTCGAQNAMAVGQFWDVQDETSSRVESVNANLGFFDIIHYRGACEAS